MSNLLAAVIALAVFGDPAVTSTAAVVQADAVQPCAKTPSGRKAPLVSDGATYFILATLLEDQGRGNLRPEYDSPENLCVVESFQVGAMTVGSTYAGFTKGMQTLLYRFEVDGEESREILVLYSGMLSFVSGKGSKFSVTETRADRVDIYAIYDREPPYKQVRTLVEGVLSGREMPMLSAEWQDGEDELMITVFDSERLK